MCGIVGAYRLPRQPLPPMNFPAAMESLRHRGPDDEGSFHSTGIFLGARRLAIIDPEHGHQPVQDDTGRFHLVMNGEIYDYDRLGNDLRRAGHRLASHCDTEVAVHLFADRWRNALDAIAGQFALAVYDRWRHRLLLARDRMGISPLFYARVGDCLLFASEAKALFATGLVQPKINRRMLDAVLSMGCVPSPNTLFEGVHALPPGRYLEITGEQFRERVYWDIPYPPAGEYPRRKEDDWCEQFSTVLQQAVRRRLKADVPVGMYLSGGIDSATIASLAADADDVRKRVFSITFPEPGFDESAETQRIAAGLGLDVHMLPYPQEQLSRDLPRLLYISEMPMVSTESVPLMALSGLASQYGKVVLTGEGADEALGGYAFFRWQAFQERFGLAISNLCGLAYRRLGELNPLIPTEDDVTWAERVFGGYPAAMMKFRFMRRLRDMVYSNEMLANSRRGDDAEFTTFLPRKTMDTWDPFNRSLYVSSRVFMTHHLLGAHGDRALMANSVEGRYPFLDRDVQEFLASVPPTIKTRWYSEKYLLRRAMRNRLPAEVIRRRKKPFLAPFGTPFVGDSATEEIREALSPGRLSEFGYFDPKRVAQLIRQLETQKKTIEADTGDHLRFNRSVIERTMLGMALTFVVSTQLLEQMIRDGRFHSSDYISSRIPRKRMQRNKMEFLTLKPTGS
jgi:asparagine synthase (glutamine-hydrolysing)